MNIATVKDDDLVGIITKTLYGVLQDPELKIEPSDGGGIRFEGKYESIVLEDDTLYCEHKSAEWTSEDHYSSNPDAPATTRHFTWCGGCETELEPDEPDDDPRDD